MRIVALSDTHRMLHQITIPHGDVLVHAGDLTGRGSYQELLEEGFSLMKLKKKFKHRIVISGNHDFGFQKNKKIILEECFDKDVIYLEDSGIEIDGVKFWGSPWSLPFYNWAFMKPEEELIVEYAKIPTDTNILITHCPPHGILDKNAEGYHCGSVALYNRVKELHELKHHIFGHIHESYGIEEIGDITFHNVCNLNGRYRYTNEPQVIDL